MALQTAHPLGPSGTQVVPGTPAPSPFPPVPPAGNEPLGLGPLAPPPVLVPERAQRRPVPTVAEARAPYEAAPVTNAVTAQPAPLSRGMAQLFNACVLDSQFCEAFLASPVRAATNAVKAPGQTFGCTLPDPALQLPPIALDDADWALLERLPRLRTLGDLAGYLSGRPVTAGDESSEAA